MAGGCLIHRKDGYVKVAEALTERAGLDAKIKLLRARAKGAARYLEGEPPPESAQALLAEVMQLMSTRTALIARVNLTNASTFLEENLTVTAGIARRDLLQHQAVLLNEMINEASPGSDPYSRSGRRRAELPERTDLPVAQLRTEADNLSRQYRELDTKIQFSNWNTELI